MATDEPDESAEDVTGDGAEADEAEGTAEAEEAAEADESVEDDVDQGDDEDADADADDEDSDDAGPGQRPVLGGGLLQLSLVLVAAAALVLCLFTWWRATGHDDAEVERAEARDAVLITARRHIETMNSLDYTDVDGGLKKWEAVTTGTLHDQIAGTSKEDRQLLSDQQKVSVGRVVDAAVVDLDGSTATVIAAVEVTVEDASDPGAEPTVKRNRFAADLLKVGGEWLLETLDQVAVNIT